MYVAINSLLLHLFLHTMAGQFDDTIIGFRGEKWLPDQLATKISKVFPGKHAPAQDAPLVQVYTFGVPYLPHKLKRPY